MEYIGIYSAVNDLSMLAASRGRPIMHQFTSQLLHHFDIVDGGYSKAQDSMESVSFPPANKFGKLTTRTSSL